MKKSSTIVLSLLMALTMVFGLTGCVEEEITLTNKTIYGLSFDVPDDFGDFEEKQGVMIASNAESTASIAVSGVGDAQGYALEDWTKESYTQATLPNYTDVNFIEFKTNATISGSTALYAHFTAKNSSGVELETYNYLIYLPVEDGNPMFQSITFSMGKDADTSLEATIDAVKSSLKFE